MTEPSHPQAGTTGIPCGTEFTQPATPRWGGADWPAGRMAACYAGGVVARMSVLSNVSPVASSGVR